MGGACIQPKETNEGIKLQRPIPNIKRANHIIDKDQSFEELFEHYQTNNQNNFYKSNSNKSFVSSLLISIINGYY